MSTVVAACKGDGGSCPGHIDVSPNSLNSGTACNCPSRWQYGINNQLREMLEGIQRSTWEKRVMKLIKKFAVTICAILSFAVFAKQSSVISEGNHAYTEVKISYATSELTKCSFQYSSIDFCDEKHVAVYNEVLGEKSANFNGHYIILVYPEFKEYHQRSVVAIDTKTGVVYPLPIDAFSGFMRGRSVAKDEGKISYSLKSNKVCINGAILVYRAFEEGNFCFEFVGDKFVGHHTEYMYP
ncbi:hypothetical protein KTE11_25495 [Burkholderia multivorans]|uniref:hypothetical protein n=1 Tax=Burkholderia multivorans TaxID=87883 RepID=UPI001C25B1F9|nr:hypothetical protein [Burkholderia multivorans]MBU9348065.1 hypothetical protein [Burkholderia multivorans]